MVNHIELNGNLPAGWLQRSIKDFAETKAGGTPATKHPHYWDGDVPWINSGALKDTFVSTPSRFITKLGLSNSAAKLLPPDSVLIALTGATTGRVGYLAIPCSTNQSVVGILPNDNHDSCFLFYYLMSIRDYVLKQASGAAQPHINKQIVDDIQVTFPPLPEQRAIAHVLRTVQQAKEATQKVIDATRQLKQSMMTHLFTCGPVPIQEAGELPASWSLRSLGEIAELIQYGTSSRCADNVDSTPVIRIPNVIGGVIDSTDLKYLNATDSEIDRFQLKEGDILFVRTNGQKRYVGRSAVYQGEPNGALFASYLIRVRVDSSQAVPEFLNIYVETAQGKEMLSGRAINSADGKYNINTQTIREVMVPIPSLSEQRGIIEQMRILRNKLDCEGKRLESLQIIFKSLLHNLMTSKVRLPEFINNGSSQ